MLDDNTTATRNSVIELPRVYSFDSWLSICCKIDWWFNDVCLLYTTATVYTVLVALYRSRSPHTTPGHPDCRRQRSGRTSHTVCRRQVDRRSGQDTVTGLLRRDDDGDDEDGCVRRRPPVRPRAADTQRVPVSSVSVCDRTSLNYPRRCFVIFISTQHNISHYLFENDIYKK